MPKTQSAFWLKDFDETKILQRPYFKKFELPDVPDAELLSMLKVCDEDAISEMEGKLTKVKDLHDKAQDYLSFANRYSDRLKKVHGETYGEYLGFIFALPKLITELRRLYYENEKRIQKEYQRIFIERLRKYRKAAGLTLTRLGDLVQVSPRGMSHYSRGAREMPLHTLARVAKILNVSTDELLGLR